MNATVYDLSLNEALNQAAIYTAVSSAGYPGAVLLALALLALLPGTFQTDASENSASSSPSSFGRIMLAMEAVDSIPEAMLVAAATVRGHMTVALAVSMCALNMVSAMAIALDYLATRPQHWMNRVMLVIVYFSVGSLIFSVSVTVFEGLRLLYPGYADADAVLSVCVAGGAALGMALTLGILLAEHRLMGKRDHEQEGQGRRALVGQLCDDLGRQQQLLERAHRASDAPQAAREQAERIYLTNIAALQQAIAVLDAAGSLAHSTDLEVASEAEAVVHDEREATHLALLDTRRPAGPPGRAGRAVLRKAGMLLGAMALIVLWTLGLTLACVPLFASTALRGPYAQGFADGLSGGAFLSIISSTLVPRIQHDAFRARLTSLQTRVVGTLAFMTGIACTVWLEAVAG